jgi:hypothetical protein
MRKELKNIKKNIQKNEDIIYFLKNDNLEKEGEGEENKENKENKENIKVKKEEKEINLNIEDIENENEKLLDGHTEIQYLDKEPTKFARQISKII